MNDSLVLTVGIFAFVMMLIGLALTAWEFRYGQPRREAARAPASARRQTGPEEPSSLASNATRRRVA